MRGSSPSRCRKVVVIGLDGLEPTIVEEMLARGKLPNIARLASPAGVARVATTYPALTPVAWSTFATGTNPGGHGVFDFLRRIPQSYQPDNGLNRYEQKNPLLPARVVNLQRAVPVWERLSSAGVESVILRCPCAYPPGRLRGSLLSGLGVPDLRGGFGTSTFYSSDPDVASREGENAVRVVIAGDGSATTHLIGPRHPRTRDDVHLEMSLSLDPVSDRVIVRSAGSPRELTVQKGVWSDWLRVKFKIGLLQSVSGVVRFYLVALEPRLELYASPINFDPAAPPFDISTPPEYAEELANRLGTYSTIGLVEDTNGLRNGRFDEEAFLAQCDDAWRERSAMMLHELEQFHSGLFYCLFDTPDRVQHMLWRFGEPDHPANRNAAPSPAFEDAIEAHYRRGDEVVGKVLEFVDEQTLLIVLSDHGFGSFQRGFHVNKWLLDEGLLALKAEFAPGQESGDLLRHVDWERTRAYCLGLGGLYLNLQGREGRGTVKPEDAEGLKADIVQSLSGMVDPERGVVAVRSALAREQVYSGPYVDESPDVLVNYARGYRVSWSSSLGAVAAGAQFEDNTRKWSGDHAVDPAVVPGVLFMNRPFRADGASLVDLAPTILEALGAPSNEPCEGQSLLIEPG